MLLPHTLSITHALGPAVAALAAGQCVAFPTETVFGLGADATQTEAVQRIFELKGRPSNHPLIVHLAQLEGDSFAWAQWVQASPALLAQAQALATAFWPGPLSLVLPKAPWVPLAVTGGKGTVALRMPAHPAAQQLLQAWAALPSNQGRPSGLAAPSANRFGHISPTRPSHVVQEFGQAFGAEPSLPHPLTLWSPPQQSECSVGLASTLLALSEEVPPTLLRPGAITVPQLEAVLGQKEEQPTLQLSASQSQGSGTLAQHYAPAVPCHWAFGDDLEEALWAASPHQALGVLAFGPCPLGLIEPFKRLPNQWLVAPTCPQAYAALFYHHLRLLEAPLLEASPAAALWVEAPPQGEAWQAVWDRLQRACAP